MPDYQARCSLLEEENETLRIRIEFLEEQLGVQFDSPVFLGLTAQEAKLFGVLLSREAVTKRLAMDVLYGDKPDGEVAEEKIIDVFICKLRKKLVPFGIDIKTNWGQGHYMPLSSKHRFRELSLSQQSAAA